MQKFFSKLLRRKQAEHTNKVLEDIVQKIPCAECRRIIRAHKEVV